VELAPNMMQQVTRAAAVQHQTPAQWIAETLSYHFGVVNKKPDLP
jgi:hypothetical protein